MRYEIGKSKLEGQVKISGAKNSVLGLMAASMLSSGVTTIENVPNIYDVENMIKIMEKVGSEITTDWENHILYIDNTYVNPDIEIGFSEIKELRASYYLMGSLLGRFKKCCVSLPGGCVIGVRPINLHIKGFELLGADTVLDEGKIIATAEQGMHGAPIFFDFASVGATINVMLAAVMAEGKTTLLNAAKEPHVIDVANMLVAMGADIRCMGDRIIINGVKTLHPTRYRVVPDQIEAGTFLIAAAATKGEIEVLDVIPSHLDCITYKLEEIGCRIERKENSVICSAKDKSLIHTRISTAPYPGFPTDLQPQMAVLLGLCKGTSIVCENVFENRYLYVDEMTRLGGKMKVSSRTNVIYGVKHYSQAEVTAPDLRAGAALVIACFNCGGIVGGTKHIERGYEDFCSKFKNLNGLIDIIE